MVRKNTGGIPNIAKDKAARDFINSQIYFKGYTVGMGAGNNPNAGPIDLGGKARRLFGVTIFVQRSLIAEDDIFSLTLNQEVIIDKCIWRAFNPEATGNDKQQQFFPIPRPLSGKDDVVLSWTAGTAKNVFFIFYLSDSDQ